MTRILLPSLFFILGSSLLMAQKKSELIAEIQVLESKLDSTEALIGDARRNERISQNKAESFEKQVQELQEANATLLQNLNNFAQVSNKNSSAINQALGSLEEKENQLKDIKDAISSNDSTAIVVLTRAKQSLGENAKIGVSNGAVIISASLDMLFGGSSDIVVEDSAQTWVGQVANVLKAHPNIALTIEGLSMTGELDIAAQQATAVGNILQKNFAIDPTRIRTTGMDGNFKEGINLKLHPKYDQFYNMVKENMKN